MAPATHRPTPLTVYLPFNRDCLRDAFVPAKAGATPPEPRGHWLLVQDQALLVVPEGDRFQPARRASGRPGSTAPPATPSGSGHSGRRPAGSWASPRARPSRSTLSRETLVPMQGTRLPDELLSLGGMAMQLLWWESTSGHCPRCGEPMARISGEWGKQCARCRYEHYPHLHPAVITLVRDGSRVLLARKAGWAPGRYALVAGFVDNGESLEGAVAREVKEEVGVDVTDIQYVGSQNWPFPSQLMIGFVARYAGGEIAIDKEELEDARWFDCDKLPTGPSRHSIAGFIIANHARP